ncbi:MULTISPECIES: hypothetical protein [Acinetobacter]|uniref:Uncharacterized protein n=1 Tax=Acinetobacter piscicola TaxID=2006115 RepID=A0A7S6VWC8_9GAMM|nr:MULTISPECIES: hypothetical protein [Acinetobacter]QOW46063.1 hypothetical protein G0028_09240 [Acinetobacter piscicola]
MPIETNNLVIYKSERLSDTTDGGGKYSGQQLIDGQSNNLFNDISELDRTMGDVSMRKIFPAVTTNDTDVLMGATVFISELPEDPNVSATLFSTKDWTDERQSAQNRVESYLAKGGQAVGLPLDTHWKGMKILQTVMFPSETELSAGNSFVIISNEGGALEFEQYVRITKVETRIGKMIIDNKEVEYKVATYTLNDPLLMDFVGVSVRQWYNGEKSTSILRETLVADTGNYYSSTGVADDVNVGTYTVNAKSMFTQLIPAAQSETPIIDVNANSENMTLIAGNNGTISASYPTTIGENQNLYLASSVMPGTVAFILFNQSITDQGGILKNSNGVQVGAIDYQRGLIRWTQSAGTGNTTLNITFKPASAPVQPYHSYALPVTQNNQSTNWTGVITPIPAPGSLTISYMAQGKFYVLKDDGSGMLKGASSSFGSGTISYETGSWLLTTGALPDVDTPILLLWGTPITTFIRSNLAVQPAAFEFDLAQQGIAANSVTVTWMLEGQSKTATSNAQGKFTGDATGTINYAKGTGRLVPNKLPQKGTVFTVNYNYGTALEQSKVSSPDADGKLVLNIGSGAAIQPNSVEIVVPVRGSTLAEVTLVDQPINATTGNMVDLFGNVQGTITYASGLVSVTPFLDKTTEKMHFKGVRYMSSGVRTA